MSWMKSLFLVVSLTSAACAKRKFNADSEGNAAISPTAPVTVVPEVVLKAVPGTPFLAAIGVLDAGQNYVIDSVTYVMNPPPGQEQTLPAVVPVVIANSGSGYAMSSAALPGKEIPLRTPTKPYYGNTYESSKSVNCNDVIQIVTGKGIAKTDPSAMCRVEVNSTSTAEKQYDDTTDCTDGKCVDTSGAYGFYVSVFPVGPSDSGFPAGVPATDNPSPSSTVPLFTAGPAASLNQLADPAFAAHMVAVQKEFKVDNSYVNSCLMNIRAWQWTDLASHYYCQFPYDTMRSCYSTNLVIGRKRKLIALTKAAGGAQLAREAVVGATYAAMNESYDTCFVKKVKGFGPNAAGATVTTWFATPQNEQAFKYAMFNIQYVRDFNINSESAVINDFYAKSGIVRSRRVTDVWPEFLATNWPLAQPRYQLIRGVQQKAAAAAAAAAPN